MYNPATLAPEISTLTSHGTVLRTETTDRCQSMAQLYYIHRGE